ncbi:MAG: DJ-1/PfpI family protein [Xanthomonadaceae bacterium]|nr:DJ-1/PfpI family protein [Xanthomonadaceae bacterium]
MMAFLLLSSTSAFAAKKVLMFVANDFMWPEYYEPRKLYENAGFKVTTTGRFKEELSPDRRNFKEYKEARKIQMDLSFDEVKIDDYDAITFVGGNGAWHDFFPTQRVHELLIEAINKNKVVALLCTSTGLLGLVGNFDGKNPIAKDKKVVGYFRVEGILKSLGKVKFVDGGQKEATVAVDGNIITGRNPESSVIFGEKVVEILSKSK